jgi:hypothetical protein
MVVKECNSRAGVYKVQTFGTTQPYIRMESFKDLKEYLRNHFASHDERSDLYTYFIEKSHKIMNGCGLYGMIVSNKFLRAKYGKPLREVLSKNSNLYQIVDLAGLPVFSGATVRPIILLTSIKKLENYHAIYSPPLAIEEFRIVEKGLMSLEKAIQDISYELGAEDLHKPIWSFSRGDISALIGRLNESFLPLKEYSNLIIGYGIKTGFEEAFVIDERIRAILINKDRKSEEIIKPYLNGRDIRRYNLDFKKIYLLYTYRGIDIEQYPAVKEYLMPFKDNLMKRATKQEWYELQQPQFKYTPYFNSPKIVFPDIAISPRFALDNSGFYGSTTTFFISKNDPYLLGLLNSKLSFLYFSENCVALEGKNEKYLRFKSQYIESFPVRIINHSDPHDAALHNKMVSLVENPCFALTI